MNTKQCINCCELKKQLQTEQLLVRQFKEYSFDVAKNCFEQLVNNQTNYRTQNYLPGGTEPKIGYEEEIIQELPNYETYEKLEGVVDLGKEYEYLTSSLCALKFCKSDEIKNFRMTTNNKKWDKFDDLEIDAECTDGKQIRFLFQLKLTLNCKEQLLLDMSTHENAFRKKNKLYLMNFLNLIDNLAKTDGEKESKTTVYILYSNFHTRLQDGVKLSFKKNPTTLIAKEVQIPFQDLLLASPEQKIFQFQPENKQNSSFEETCKSFYLVCGQPNVEAVKARIKTMLRDSFHCYIYEYYEQFMRSWWIDNFILIKNDLIVKLVDFILSPYIKTISDKKSNGKSKILETAILNFELTLLENDKECIICNIWSQLITEDELKAIPPIFDISSKNLTPFQRTKVLWYLGKAPLIINAEEIEDVVLKSVLELIQKCLRIKKVVLLGKSQKANFGRWKKFNLSDLKSRNFTVFSKLTKELKVSIQGRKHLSFENLISIDKTFLEIFSIKELLLMTQNEYLQIGYQNKDLSFYVNRRLSTGVVRVKEVASIFDQSDTVIISCKTPKKDSLLYRCQNIIIIDSAFSDINSTFNTECTRNKEGNVYVLQQIDEEFCILILHNSNNLETKMLEKEFQDMEIVKNLECSSLNVICGPAGIGKSQLMKSLSKNTSPDSWTISINLILFNTFLSTNPNYETIKTKLLTLDEENILVSKTKNLLLKNGKFSLFLDGLDEVTSKYLYLVLDFIRRIIKEGVKVWTSSRDHLKEKICKSLGAVFVKIQPFNDREEILYIRKKLKDQYKEEELNYIQKTLSKNMHLANCREVLGSPLLLHIITEVFLNSKQAYENLQKQDVLALTEMFRLFFIGKIRTTFEKLDIDQSETPQLGIGEDDYLENYEVAALKACLEETDFRKLNIESGAIRRLLTQILMEGDKFGIIKEIIHDETSDNFLFCHKSYAEYFAGVWFKKNQEKFWLLRNEMFLPKYEGLRRMFDILMAENNPLHLAAIYKNPEQFQKHLENFSKKDEGGRTVAHLVFSYGEKYSQTECNKDESEVYERILKLLFETEFDLHCKDKLLEATPMEYALMTNCLYPLEKSLEERTFITNEIVNNLCQTFDIQALTKFVLQLGYHNLLTQLLLLEPSCLTTKFEGNSLLHLASLKENNAKIITILIERDLQVDIKNDKRQTALFLATEKKLIKNIETLLKKGASPTLQDDDGVCPLFLACSKEPNASIIEMFASSINFEDEVTGNTALLVACQNGCIENVQKLLEMGANLSALNLNNENALHFASCSAFENKKVIEFLISKGFDLNAKNRFGYVPLQLACKKGCVENVQLLTEKGADFNITTIYNENLLHLASSSKKRNSKMIDFLISNGLDVNAKISIGLTPLLLAAQKGIAENIRKLIDKGAETDALDECNGSALHRACSSENENPEVINLLIKCGLEVNAKDINGDTPLFEACCKASLENVMTLIENGADLYELNNRKENALHFASRSEKANVDVINLLINKGFNVNCKEVKGNTPLLLACSKGCLENVKTLISRGADVNALNTNCDNALHRASWCDHDNTEVIKLLITRGLNPDVRNSAGQSAIDVATKFRYSEEKIAALNQNRRSLLQKLWF